MANYHTGLYYSALNSKKK